ncbi:MAG TPA: AAA family ATPase [Gemmatimonadaceae bacterium]|nr:AAA family ATPase [Gemmatimonadaceae bacterium]
MQLSLTSLGSASLTSYSLDGSAQKVLRPGKPLALLIYLAASSHRTASREHLIDTLWADVEPERGLRTLRQTIWQIRQLFGDAFITGDGREITLAAPLKFDRDEFLSAVARAQYEEAIDLYKGPFIPDFGVPGGADFEQWADRERDRLHLAYVRSAEAIVRLRLDRAQYEKAISEARRLRDSEPGRESSWRLLLEALSASGDRISAIAEAEALQRFLSEENRSPEQLTVSAIARAQKNLNPARSAPANERLVADLTGRDKEFACLTAAWVAAKSGKFQNVHVSAPPGLGKTRLLQDVFTRLRAGGARAVFIRGIAADRRLAYALASDVAAKVGVLSGASGISTAAASSLLALTPSLSSSFSAAPDRASDEEALRRRIHAISELLDAVAEEAPLALFIDDLHWGDAVSRQLLKSVFSRIGGARLLLITSSRTQPDGDLHLPGGETLALLALTRSQVSELVCGFGSLPDAPWVTRFLNELHTQSNGSPLLLLENLHLAFDRGSLQLKDQHWGCLDEKALIDGLARGDILEQRLMKLDRRQFETLLLLGLAEEPLDIAVIADALKRDRAAIEADLSDLELQAMSSSEGDIWKVSHDSIAESAVRMCDTVTKRKVLGDLGVALSRSAGADPHRLRLALHHLIDSGKTDEADNVFRRFVSTARRNGDRRSNIQLAIAALDESHPSPVTKRLVASLPIMQRVGLTNRARIAGAAAVLFAAAALPFELLPSKPARLAVVTQPLSGTLVAIVPAPVIEIQDKQGNRVRGASDTVSVDVIGGGTALLGTRSVAARDGRAVFSDISLGKSPPLTSTHGTVLRFKSRGLTSVQSSEFNVPNGHSTLRLVAAVINGQVLSPSHRQLVVKRGEQIEGTVKLEYSSFWASASVILGVTATWGDRARNFIDLAPLTTPVVNQPRRAAITFKAPDKPGTYHIVFAFDAEGNVEDFISGTNWKLPEPVWNDGNDIADWSATQLAHANEAGWAATRIYRIDDVSNKAGFFPHSVASTAIDVVVK